MLNFLKILKKLYLPAGLIFVSCAFTAAYFSDEVAVGNNIFSTGVWSEPLINEVFSHPDASKGEKEWIELLNTRPQALALTGYTIEDGTGAQKNLSSYSIPANGYLVLEKGVDFSFGLNDSGDIVILRKSGSIVDKVTYGDWNDGDLSDNAPAPAMSQSIGRTPDGRDTNNDSADFQIKIVPTPGGPN